MSTSFVRGGFGASSHLGDALSALLDGELPNSQAATARAHLAACAACTQEMLAVTQARSWVRALPAVNPPFGFYERMLLNRTPPLRTQVFANRATLRRRAGLAALGAAAAAVTVLGVGSPAEGPARSPGTPRLVQAHAASALAGADLMSKLAPVAVPVSFGR